VRTERASSLISFAASFTLSLKSSAIRSRLVITTRVIAAPLALDFITMNELDLSLALFVLTALLLDVLHDLFDRGYIVVAQATQNAFLHLSYHLLKEDKPLALILVEWVLLSVASQSNSLSQMIHLKEVVAPKVINALKNRILLYHLETDRSVHPHLATVKLRGNSDLTESLQLLALLRRVLSVHLPSGAA
jgi:hypothetical protein